MTTTQLLTVIAAIHIAPYMKESNARLTSMVCALTALAIIAYDMIEKWL